jgi:chromosome segregation ATPase
MSEPTNQEEREPTQKELNEYRENMKKFYDTQIPMLKKQKEYESLLADIEEARLKRITMNMRIAQIMAGPPEPPSQEEMDEARERMQEAMQEQEEDLKPTPETEEEEESPKKVRQLKKQ